MNELPNEIIMRILPFSHTPAELFAIIVRNHALRALYHWEVIDIGIKTNPRYFTEASTHFRLIINSGKTEISNIDVIIDFAYANIYEDESPCGIETKTEHYINGWKTRAEVYYTVFDVVKKELAVNTIDVFDYYYQRIKSAPRIQLFCDEGIDVIKHQLARFKEMRSGVAGEFAETVIGLRDSNDTKYAKYVCAGKSTFTVLYCFKQL